MNRKFPTRAKRSGGVANGRKYWFAVCILTFPVYSRPIANGLLDGTMRIGLSDSWPRHRPIGSAIECDGLEDFPYARTIDNASRLAPELPGRACDKLQVQVASGAVLR